MDPVRGSSGAAHLQVVARNDNDDESELLSADARARSRGRSLSVAASAGEHLPRSPLPRSAVAGPHARRTPVPPGTPPRNFGVGATVAQPLHGRAAIGQALASLPADGLATAASRHGLLHAARATMALSMPDVEQLATDLRRLDRATRTAYLERAFEVALDPSDGTAWQTRRLDRLKTLIRLQAPMEAFAPTRELLRQIPSLPVMSRAHAAEFVWTNAERIERELGDAARNPGIRNALAVLRVDLATVMPMLQQLSTPLHDDLLIAMFDHALCHHPKNRLMVALMPSFPRLPREQAVVIGDDLAQRFSVGAPEETAEVLRAAQRALGLPEPTAFALQERVNQVRRQPPQHDVWLQGLAAADDVPAGRVHADVNAALAPLRSISAEAAERDPVALAAPVAAAVARIRAFSIEQLPEFGIRFGAVTPLVREAVFFALHAEAARAQGPDDPRGRNLARIATLMLSLPPEAAGLHALRQAEALLAMPPFVQARAAQNVLGVLASIDELSRAPDEPEWAVVAEELADRRAAYAAHPDAAAWDTGPAWQALASKVGRLAVEDARADVFHAVLDFRPPGDAGADVLVTLASQLPQLPAGAVATAAAALTDAMEDLGDAAAQRLTQAMGTALGVPPGGVIAHVHALHARDAALRVAAGQPA